MPERPQSDLRSEIVPILASTAPLTTGTAVFFCLPLFVGAAADSLGLAPRQQGLLAAMDVSGAAVAGLCSLWWIERFSWRRVAVVSQVLLVVGNLLSIGVEHLPTLFAFRVFCGFNAGTIFAVSLAALGVCRDADRGFAIAIALQIAIGACALYMLGGWIERWGFDGVLYYLSGLSIVLALPLRWIPSRVRAASGTEDPDADARGPDWKGYASLASYGTLVFGVAAFWAFAERMGVAAGLSSPRVAAALGTSLFAAMAGVLLASWMGSRWGIVGPIVIGLVVAAVSMGFFQGRVLPDYAVQYAAAAVVFQVGWNFSTPFSLAVIARADPRARLIAVSAAVQAAGAALGPPIAGFLVKGDDYTSVIGVGILAMGLTIALVVPAALEQQRALRAVADDASSAAPV